MILRKYPEKLKKKLCYLLNSTANPAQIETHARAFLTLIILAIAGVYEYDSFYEMTSAAPLCVDRKKWG